MIGVARRQLLGYVRKEQMTKAALRDMIALIQEQSGLGA